jgi:hypothetical protein
MKTIRTYNIVACLFLALAFISLLGGIALTCLAFLHPTDAIKPMSDTFNGGIVGCLFLSGVSGWSAFEFARFAKERQHELDRHLAQPSHA